MGAISLHDHPKAAKQHQIQAIFSAAIPQGRNSPDIWKDCTGLSVQELWTEHMASLTAAGSGATAGAVKIMSGS